MTQPTALTYRDAGVDIDAGNALVERIKPLVKKSFRPEVMGGLGGGFLSAALGLASVFWLAAGCAAVAMLCALRARRWPSQAAAAG